jgi:hypothetical protein
MSNEDLPSINDIVEESNLPSYKDFIEVKQEEELPSVEEYIEEKVVETFEEEVVVEEEDQTSDLTEIVRLINDVRKDIPQIPEIKYYDEELSELNNKLTHIEEYFTQIESKIPEVPTIRYYDHDIEHINDRITELREDVSSLPEIRHYDSDISSLAEELREVKSRDVPDFRWIGNTFNTIDEDFTKVHGHLDVIKEKISSEVSEINETIQEKDLEQNINVKNLKDSISEKIDQTNTKLTETKDKIYSELSKSSLKVWEYHREFKDDDRKLKKAILSEQNKLKQKLEEEITSINKQSIEADETLLKFFNDIREEVNSLPEVKYYDDELSSITEDVDSLKTTVSELKNIASLIKKDQKELKENYLLNEPPDEKESVGSGVDPLTPMDQKFATLDDLSNHYRIFINRIQTQLSTMGGGGAGFIKDLDDVTFDQTTGQGQLLIYSGSKWVGIASTAVGGGAASELAVNATGTNLTLTGDLNVTGDIIYDEANARNWNVSGIATVGTAFYMPQYTTTERDAASFNEGAMIYNKTSKKLEFYDGTSWQSLPGMSLGLTVALDG